jgi:cobalt/nickel transport system permease protein
MTYITTSVELALAFPGANMGATFMTFFGIFAITQIPLAIAEGLLTTVIYNYIQSARPDILVKLGVISEQEAGAN